MRKSQSSFSFCSSSIRYLTCCHSRGIQLNRNVLMDTTVIFCFLGFFFPLLNRVQRFLKIYCMQLQYNILCSLARKYSHRTIVYPSSIMYIFIYREYGLMNDQTADAYVSRGFYIILFVCYGNKRNDLLNVDTKRNK